MTRRFGLLASLITSTALFCGCGRGSHPAGPSAPASPAPAPARPVSTNGGTEYAYGSDPLQRLDFVVPAGSTHAPIVLLVHGGGWWAGDRADVRPYVSGLVAAGFAVANVNYRLAQHPAAVEDVLRALDWLGQHGEALGADPSHCAIYGESAGAQIAGEVVFIEGRCGAFVGLGGIYDLPATPAGLSPAVEWLLGCPLQACSSGWREASPALNLRYRRPALLMWGDADALVPRDQIESMSRALGASARTFVAPGRPHTGGPWISETGRMAEFLKNAGGLQ